MAKQKRQGAVLVTGAAGTVGGYLVRTLTDAGHRVIATDLPEATLDLPEGADIEVRLGDLTDLGFCVDAVRGASAVIHAAATINLRLPEETIRKINVDAVRFLYEAARASGAERFLFLSSGSIYAPSDGPIDEAQPFKPVSAYERSKVSAERYLWSRDRAEFPVTILRPSMIYGPRGRFLGARLACVPPMLAVLFAEIPVLEGGARCNWVHAEDVARAAVHLLSHEAARWEAYNVADDTPLPIGAVLEAVTEAYGLPTGRRLDFPARLMAVGQRLFRDRPQVLAAGTTLLDRVWRAICRLEDLRPELGPALDREIFDYATANMVFETKKLRQTGFTPKYPSMKEGYAAVLPWYQEHRWVPRYDGRSRAWGDGLGVRFDEMMQGEMQMKGQAAEAPFRFSVTARAGGLRQLARDGRLALTGTVHAGGLADGVPCKGTLEITVGRHPTLRYDLRFDGDDGRPLRYLGTKRVSGWHILRTMTTLRGEIEDGDGNAVGTAVARFDLKRDLGGLLRSVRLQSGSPQPATVGAGA